MSSSRTGRSREHLKWRTHFSAFSFEILEFEKVTDDTSKLRLHVIYESVAQRDQLLKLPFAQRLKHGP